MAKLTEKQKQEKELNDIEIKMYQNLDNKKEFDKLDVERKKMLKKLGREEKIIEPKKK